MTPAEINLYDVILSESVRQPSLTLLLARRALERLQARLVAEGRRRGAR